MEIDKINLCLYNQSIENIKDYIKKNKFSILEKKQLLRQIVIENKLSLLKKVFDEQIFDPQDFDNLALREAAALGYYPMVVYLIEEKKCDYTIWNHYPIRWAIINGHVFLVKYMVNKFYSPKSEFFSILNNEILNWVANNGHLSMLKYLFEELQYIPYTNNIEMLKLAARNGHLKVVQYLIEEAKFNYKFFGLKILSEAVKSGNIDLVKYLIKDKQISIAGQEQQLLLEASLNGSLPMYIYLTEEIKIDPTKSLDLIIKNAFSSKSLEFIKYILDKENINDKNTITAVLSYAVIHGDKEILNFVIDKLKVNIKDYASELLEAAIVSSNISMCEYLVKDCGVSILNNNFKLLSVIGQFGNEEIFVFFEEKEHIRNEIIWSVCLNEALVSENLTLAKFIIEKFPPPFEAFKNFEIPNKKDFVLYLISKGYWKDDFDKVFSSHEIKNSPYFGELFLVTIAKNSKSAIKKTIAEEFLEKNTKNFKKDLEKEI